MMIWLYSIERDFHDDYNLIYTLVVNVRHDFTICILQ